MVSRMRRLGVRPDRELGQNFLIDSNILGVIGRLAELDERDVVLEIGGGLGVLSEHLAVRVGHVHVVEIDERLRDPLGEAVDRFENVTVHWADALEVDLAAMRPPPTKVVANLPYGVAAGALLRTVEELATVTRWVAMVQREVGERLAAAPGSRAYGAPSVIAQLACEVRVARAIPRTVFHPVPNVDSVLVEMTRTAPAPAPALRGLVGAAFAHRRKTVARSIALAGESRGPAPRSADPMAGGIPVLPMPTSFAAPTTPTAPPTPRYTREQVLRALERIGRPRDVRAERLSPDDFRRLTDALAAGA
jgi:16S rRNA (adenine1518-N6/adenine1519-N6)-dimethyltransferase